jgi:uncharacterized protein
MSRTHTRSEPGAGAAEQRAVIDFLADPNTHGGHAVERFATHGNLVFVAGADAFKIKRAVRFDYMDFSTLAKRHAACLHELTVNRRCGGDLYVGCVPVRRSTNGQLSFRGDGAIVEWVVHMRRFEQKDLLSTLAQQHRIDPALAQQLADAVFACHAGAERRTSSSAVTALQGLALSIGAGLAKTGVFSKAATDQLAAGLSQQLDGAAAVLAERAHRGFVRRCHGDLHLANIVLWRGRPTLYDAIEFDDALATIDTLYDLAFLLMDLDFQGLRPAANAVLNRYLWCSGDDWDLRGLLALPLFLALRAAIRARVTAERAGQEDGATTPLAHLARARRYLDAALDYLAPAPPRLFAVAGFSGSGKTTLAAALAPWIGSAPGAVHLRSDLERKALAGVAELERLPQRSYTSEARQRIYAILRYKATTTLTAKHSVIVDAVYDSEDERAQMPAIADALGVAFAGFWLCADPQRLVARVSARRHDASDATAEVVQAQLGSRTGPLSRRWTSLNAEGSAEQTLQLASAAAGLKLARTTTLAGP